ncbi:hypothetical protein N9K56_02945 [Planktomarina temperata]|nr:hypothetical protein [Planktomarina temperata]
MNATSKLVKAWESKNAKNAAKAGGVSLMALSLAACGGSSTPVADAPAADPVVPVVPVVPVAPAAKAFALTATTNVFTGGDGADTFAATHLTFNATDELAGGAGTDTLTIVDTGSADLTLAAAKVGGIEVVNITNQTGNTVSAGSKEVATVTVGGLQDGQNLTIAGQTVTATADLTATQVADILTGGTVTGGTLSGTLTTGYVKALGTNTDVVTYTGSAVGDMDDLVISGNAQVNQPQVTVLSVTTAGEDGTIITQSLSIGGVTVTGNSVAKDATAAVQATEYASMINTYLGKSVATVAGNTVQIVSDTPVSISGFAAKDEAGNALSTTAQVVNYVNAASKTTYKVTGDPTDAATVSFVMNGKTITTAAHDDSGSDAEDYNYVADLIAAAVNAEYGSTVATVSTDTVTIDTGDVGLAIGGFTASAGSIAGTQVSVTASSGSFVSDPSTISIVDGTAAVTAATFDTTADASKFTGSTEMASVNSTGDVVFSNMVSTQSGTVAGNTAVTNGNTTFGHKATAASAAIAIQDGTTAGNITLTGAGITSAAITSTGEKNTVGAIDLAAAKTVTLDASTNLTATSIATTATAGTLTISGAGAVSLGTLDAGFDTVSAAGNSGGLTAAIGTETDTVLTGSSGADKITASSTDSIAATAKLAVNAGDGTDTLVLGDANDVNSAADGARYTGFEALDVSGSQDMSLIAGIESVAITGDSITLSNMTATQAANVSAKADFDALTMTLATATGTTDSASIVAASATATTNVDVTDLSVDNFETVSVAFNTGTAGTQSAFDFAANAADEMTKLNITGSADVKLTVDANVMDVAAVTIDASALTGKFEIADNSGTLKSGSKVIATAQDDTIAVDDTTGTTYEGGAGKDGFSAVVATLNATGANDTSIAGGDGVDTLTLTDTGAVTITDGYFTNVSTMEKLVLSSTGDQSLTLGTNFSSAFATATITTATAANEKSIEIAGGLYNGDTTIVATSDGLGDATGESHSIVTGGGDDTITLTASSFVAHATGSTITINSGAGDDSITLTTGTLADGAGNQAITIDAGAGKDTVDMTKVNGATANKFGMAKIVIESGDSLSTSYDVIKGFDDGAADGAGHLSDSLDFDGTSAVSDFAQSTDVGVIKSHSLTNGVATFDDVATFDTAVVISSANLTDVVGYLAANTAALDTVAFLFDSTGDGANDSTMVYNNNTTDSLVLLDGLSGTTSVVFEDTSTDAAISII